MLTLKYEARFSLLLLALLAASGLAGAFPDKAQAVDLKNTGKRHFPAGAIFQLSFKSKIDNSNQPFLVKIPNKYDPAKRWPLLVTLHGLGDGPVLADSIDSMLQIGPYGRGDLWYSGLGERDVLECLEVARKLFSVDNERIYLCGFSMGGAGTFKLGLRHPHLWAACVPVCGRCDDIELIANGRNVPFWIHTGKKDTILPPSASKNAYDAAVELGFTRWKYTENPDMSHSFNINWRVVEKWLLNQKRVAQPKVVSFAGKDLDANRAYWVEINSIKKNGQYFHIEASIKQQGVNLKTNNVSSYRLQLKNAQIDLGSKIKVKENGIEIFEGLLDKDGLFTRLSHSNAP